MLNRIGIGSHNSAQAARPARPTIAPAAMWVASDLALLVELGEVVAPVPAAVFAEEEVAALLLLEDEEEEAVPVDEDAICWIVRIGC